MGFDLTGNKAKSKKGEYFRNNVWWWRPLAEYVMLNCNVNDFAEWGFNNGHLVEETEALDIADKLDELIASRETAKYAREYRAMLKKLPKEKCDLCNGTGVRNDKIVQGKCNGCVKGFRDNFAIHYPFSVENVRNFSKFCRDSGGFTIG